MSFPSPATVLIAPDGELTGCTRRYQTLYLELLDGLAVPRTVATSTDRLRAIRHLEQAGILGRFNAVVTRSDVTHSKPAPDTFLRAAAALGIEPAFCLALEGSYNGIRMATSAGMMTIKVQNLLPPTSEMHKLGVLARDSLLDIRNPETPRRRQVETTNIWTF